MSAEASGPAAAEALSLEVSKPSGLEPGSAAYGLRPLTPNSKYVKLNVGGSLHYTTLRTLTGQDTMLKAMFSGRAEVLTDAGGTRAALTWAVLHPLDCRLPDPSILPPSPSVFIPLLSSHCHPVSSFSPSPASTSHLISPFSFIISLVSQSLLPAITNTYGTAPLSNSARCCSDSPLSPQRFHYRFHPGLPPFTPQLKKLRNQPCCQQHPSRQPSSVSSNFPAFCSPPPQPGELEGLTCLRVSPNTL